MSPTFGTVVSLLRELNGVSVRRLARDIGISHTQLGRIEAGELLPATPQIRQFAEVLGIRADVLARASLGVAA